MERSAARGRYREITPYLLPTNEMSNKAAILLTGDELVDTNKNIAIKAMYIRSSGEVFLNYSGNLLFILCSHLG